MIFRCKILVVLALFLLLGNGLAYGIEEDGENYQPVFSWSEAIDQVDINYLEEYKVKIDNEIGDYFGNTSVVQWITDFVNGEWQFSIKTIMNYLSNTFFREVKVNLDLLGKLILLSVITALLVNLQTSFASGVGKLSYWVCFLGIAALALGSFNMVIALATETIDTLVGFMMGMLPQMLVLTAGLGQVNSSLLLFPLLMSAATAFSAAIKTIVFPLIILSAVLKLVNHLSDSIQVEKMSKFFTQIAQLSLALIVTVFVGIVTLQAVYASVLDKVTLRTTKFVTDNAIPVVGKMFSDTIEVAAGYIVMLKQGLGILGALIVIGIILLPVLKIGAVALIYKLSSAITEPLGDARTATLLESMSNHLFLLLSAMAAVGLMFLVMIAIMVGFASGFASLR